MKIRGRSRSLLIGGSKAYDFQESAFGRFLGREVVNTPFGESAPVSLFEKEGFEYYFISRHGEGGYNLSAPFVNYQANIFGAKLLGVERVISWSGPGIIDESLSPGTFLLPDDLIDFTKGRKSTFFAGTGLGFVRQSPLFCPTLGEMLTGAAEMTGRETVKGGTYVCTEGPRLETAAEIRMFWKWGGNVVGMTVVPEVFLSKELEICYHPICYLTNFAEGVKDLPYREGVLFEGTLPDVMAGEVEEAKEGLPGICLAALKEADGIERSCPCSVSMKRYKGEKWGNEGITDWIRKIVDGYERG
jgi:5'-methylthioadenosine phosphorylase